MKAGPQQIVIVPVDVGDDRRLWQVMFEGFEDAAPLPRGWRGTVDDVMEQLLYVMENHDLSRGATPGHEEERQARVNRYREFWGRYCEMVDLRTERDRLKRENEDLRAALAAWQTANDARLPVG
jgi:hypothetical protein